MNNQQKMFAYLLKPERYSHESYQDYRVRRISTRRMLDIRKKYGIAAFNQMWDNAFRQMVLNAPGVVANVLAGNGPAPTQNNPSPRTEGNLVSQGNNPSQTNIDGVIHLDTQKVECTDTATGSGEVDSGRVEGDTSSL